MTEKNIVRVPIKKNVTPNTPRPSEQANVSPRVPTENTNTASPPPSKDD
jgi:hypothetical protein